MRIYLIGFMGCGKSSLGKRLAKRLDYPFLDIDTETEKKAGQNVQGIFETHGETYFRSLEQEVLYATTEHDRAVIATGGGTPCFNDNMDFMNANGVTVYLKMAPQSLAYRLEYAQRKRPLIEGNKGDALLQLIYDKLAEREPVYMRSNCVIKGESAKPDQIISLVFGY